MDAERVIAGLFVPNCIVDNANGHYEVNIHYNNTNEKYVTFDSTNVEFRNPDDYYEQMLSAKN
jgi:hypothetical protein